MMSESSKVRVLLTGYQGQVGHALLTSVPDAFELFLADGPDREPIDLTDHQATRRVIAGVKPEIIINAAAYTAVDKAETDVELAFAVNEKVPGVLAEIAHSIDALLVHYSTDYVFNGDQRHPAWSENDVPGPLSVYGRSKLAGEQLIQQSLCRHLIFRTSWVFSAHGHNFLKTILRLAGEREQVKVVDDQIGSPTSAGFLAAMTWLSLEKVAQNPQNSDLLGLFHLTCSGVCSWYEFAFAIVEAAKATGKCTHTLGDILPISSAEFPTVAVRPMNSKMNCSKFQSAFLQSEIQSWKSCMNEVLRNCLK